MIQCRRPEPLQKDVPFTICGIVPRGLQPIDIEFRLRQYEEDEDLQFLQSCVHIDLQPIEPVNQHGVGRKVRSSSIFTKIA